MNQKRKLLILLALALAVGTAFTGCIMIPEEYTQGVDLSSSYPEDDMPLMDNAVVYFCEEDDESVSLKYGVTEELDDVADFYKDFFEDSEITLDDETDRSTRYSADGSYMDFNFEIRVTKPSGENEQKVFKTVVKIDIEFVEDSLGTIGELQNQIPLSEKLLGFWREESFEDVNGKTPTYEYGIAYEFLSDGTLNLYYDFAFVGAGGWSQVDSQTVHLTAIDGTQEDVTVAFEKRSEKDYLIWKDSTGTIVFYRDSSDEFVFDVDTTYTSADQELIDSLSGKYWYYIQYNEADGSVQSSSNGVLIYYTDGTLADTFDNETESGNWYVSDGRLYCDYTSGNSVNWEISVTAEGDKEYLYYYSDSSPGAYWLYCSVPREILNGSAMESYTTDEEMAGAISGLEFHEMYYLYASGETEPMKSNTVIFYDDFTLEDSYEGEISTGTWLVTGGYLEINYDDGTSYHYPVYVEYSTNSGQSYLYLGDLEEGYEGCYWIFTTYKP